MFLCLLAWALPGSADDTVSDLDVSTRFGQGLYENHCPDCHESSVHIRKRHKARSMADIKAWIRRWSDYKQLGWGEREIDQVAAYLNEQFYKF